MTVLAALAAAALLACVAAFQLALAAGAPWALTRPGPGTPAGT